MTFLELGDFPNLRVLVIDQVLRLNENKDFSYVEAQKDLGFRPLSFEDGIRLELSSLK